METLKLCEKCHYGYITEEHTCKTEEEMYREAFPLDIPDHKPEYTELVCNQNNCRQPAFSSRFYTNLLFDNFYCLKHKRIKIQSIKFDFVCDYCQKETRKYFDKTNYFLFTRRGLKFCTQSCYQKYWWRHKRPTVDK